MSKNLNTTLTLYIQSSEMYILYYRSPSRFSLSDFLLSDFLLSGFLLSGFLLSEFLLSGFLLSDFKDRNLISYFTQHMAWSVKLYFIHFNTF